MKIIKLNESTEHPYMFQYNCNNSTFGYDFQRYAQELGAKRMYDHTQKGGGMHFYTVPSEEVYNKLKEVAKKEYTVDMHPMRPYDKERYANAKVQEAMTIAYSEDTIKRMIVQLKKEIEDYKQLIIDEPEDKAYWEEEIKKCEDEIADLESYGPLQNTTSTFDYIKRKYKGTTRFGTTVIAGDRLDEIDKDLVSRGYCRGKRVTYSTGYAIDYVSSEDDGISVGVNNVPQYDRFGVVVGYNVETVIASNKLYIENLYESASKYFYVTIYEQSSVSGPEEGGYTSYGWEAVKSKSFRDEESARQYHSAYIANAAEVLDDNGRGRVHIRDEWGDEVLVCLEPAHKRGSNNSPALTWAQSELGHEPPQRAYFDRDGSRVLGNPREEAKKRKEQAALNQEFRNAVNAAGSREDLIAVLTDNRFVKALSNNMDVVTAKLNEISSLKEASYGGAYDMADDQYFTREELEDFASEVISCIAAREDVLFDVCKLEAGNTIVTIGLNNAARNGDFEHEVSFKVDLRSIKYPHTLATSKYVSLVADKFIKEYRKQTAPVNESGEFLPIEVLNPDGTPKQYDVKYMDLERVPSKLSWEIADKLEDYFRNNRLWVDELYYNEPRNRIEFDINDGDWKHEHLRAKWLIEELFKSLGIRAEISSYTTEDNGTDTYSAHYSVYSI